MRRTFRLCVVVRARHCILDGRCQRLHPVGRSLRANDVTRGWLAGNGEYSTNFWLLLVLPFHDPVILLQSRGCKPSVTKLANVTCTLVLAPQLC